MVHWYNSLSYPRRRLATSCRSFCAVFESQSAPRAGFCFCYLLLMIFQCFQCRRIRKHGLVGEGKSILLWCTWVGRAMPGSRKNSKGYEFAIRRWTTLILNEFVRTKSPSRRLSFMCAELLCAVSVQLCCPRCGYGSETPPFKKAKVRQPH